MFSPEVRVVLYGVGEVNMGVARMIAEKPGLRVVGGIDTDPAKIGVDPGEVAGTAPVGKKISDDPVKILSETQPHIVIHATSAWTPREMFPQMELVLDLGIDMMSSCVGFFYPFHEEPELSRKVDRLARRNDASFLSTGIMPGFILDDMIDAFTGVCESVERIEGSRILDFAPFGPEAKKVQGIGFSPEEWEERRDRGEILGHDCFKQQIQLVADVIGFDLDEIREREFVPLVAEEARSWEGEYPDLEPGTVVGLRHVYDGLRNGSRVISMLKVGSVQVEKDGYEQGDEIIIEGTPDLEVQTSLEPGVTTWAPLVNSIPLLLNAEPGLRTVNELPVPSVFHDDVRHHLDGPLR